MIPLMNEVPVWVLSHVQLFVNPWTVPCHIPLSMESFRQDHWSGLPFPNPEDLPNPGIKPASLTSLTLAGNFYHCATWEARILLLLLLLLSRFSCVRLCATP